MATITDAKLTISHDHAKKLATPVVTCHVNFSPQDMALMNALPNVRVFKLKCQLWGADEWFNGGDDNLGLAVYSRVHYFADSTPTPTESRTFSAEVGEGVLDEDNGIDEIYGKLTLYNLVFPSIVSKKTNEVHHSF